MFEVTFQPSGRGKAQCPPDPAYPDGINVDCSLGKRSCMATLPYPAPECGMWFVHCTDCEMTIAITAAGRPDDVRTVRMACLARDGDTH